MVREAVCIIGGSGVEVVVWWADAFVIGLEGRTVDECGTFVPSGEGWFGLVGDGGGEGG